MALNDNSHFLLSDSLHQTDAHYHKVLTDPLMCPLENNEAENRRSSLTQSIRDRDITPSNTFSPLCPTHSIPLSNYPVPLNSMMSLSVRKSSSSDTNSRRLNNLCARRTSIPKTYKQDENMPLVANTSSNEFEISAKIERKTSNDEEDYLIKKKPIEIRVRCIFSRVGEIDTLNERYTAEFFFEASWYDDDRLIGKTYDPQLSHFNPQLVILNHLGDSLKNEKWYSISETDEEHIIEITEHHKIRGVFWERMELNHFPFDVQELSLSLTTPLTKSDIYFIKDKKKLSGVNRTVFSDQQSWHLYEHVEFSYDEHREEYTLNPNEVHPVVVCTCHVGRKCGYYMWNAYFLIFLITSAGLCTFGIPPSNSHGRLQITSTLLLTSVTFRWVVNKSLPTISYLTALDIYAISSIVALCIINVFHGIISYFYYDQIYITSSQPELTSSLINTSLYPQYSLCRLDRYALFTFCSLFFLFQVLILLCTMWVPYKRRRHMTKKDEASRAELRDIVVLKASK